jgi:rod shape determining protein RodA
LGPDPVLLVCALLLMTAGTLAVYAATRDGLLAQHRSGTYYLKRDLLNSAIGLVLAWAASRVRLRSAAHLLPWAYLGAVVLLLAVLTPLGATINGAHAWFRVGPVELEPSEFCKILLILITAHLLAPATTDAQATPQLRDLMLVLASLALIVLLVFAEPALGVAIVLLFIVATQIAVRGVPWPWLLGLLVAAVLTVGVATQGHLIRPYQEARFTSFLNPRTDRSGNGYHLQQSEIAIGSGGLLGQGFLHGEQTNNGFVPEQQTDFIFSVIGEESGFVGSSVLLILFALLCNRALGIARRAADHTSSLVATGVTIWYASQLFINVGMTMGLAPVTGLPLPFVSYGGSALFANLIGIGLLLGIARSTSAERAPSSAGRLLSQA